MIWAGVGLVLASLAALGLFWYKHFQVDIDGQSHPYQAFAWRVADGLNAARVSVAQGDLLVPPASQWLNNQSIIHIQRAASIAILADGKVYRLLTAERVPVKILALAGITLKPGDVLLSAGQPVSPQAALAAPGLYGKMPPLQVLRSIPFTLREDGGDEPLASTAATAGQALWEAGIDLNAADLLSPGLEAPLAPGLLITLNHSLTVTIQVQGKEITRRSAASTVGEALVEAGIALQGLDYSRPAETSALPPDGKIQVVRVSEETIIEQSPIPYQSVHQPVADLEIDNQKIVQAGVPGLAARRIRARYEDGKEVSRVVEDEWVARPPQNQITGYGTMLVEHTIDTPDGTIHYWRAVRMWATSYKPSDTGSDETASGLRVRKGLVAIDRSLIPFYTQMYVPGYGPAMAADTGGGVKGRMIDLGYPDAEYVEWHQYVMVYFLWPPPANIVWIFPP